MGSRIEQYAIIGDTQTAALVADDGSIDWLCAPRFDSAAVFAALLGDPSHGRWLLAPASGGRAQRRRYRDDTLVLETEFETDEGAVRITDCMPIRGKNVEVLRVVDGLRGRVHMRMELASRFDYGRTIPWVENVDGGVVVVAGPDAMALHAPIELHLEDRCSVGEFTIGAGERTAFALSWFPSYHDPPHTTDVERAIARTTAWWEEWSSKSRYQGEWRDLVQRSLITLKALTYAPTGGIVAAATTSLPEWPGSVRNWDYRYCWVRDATLTLLALMEGGYVKEAAAWRDWLLRAVAGEPSELQIMYGPAGERRLDEWEVDWLPGYEGSRPVRVGNAASGQFQLDVYGELMDAMYHGYRSGVPVRAGQPGLGLVRELLEFLRDAWHEPDDGIWEVRGPRQHFTHSKVMAWVAFDRAARLVPELRMNFPVERLEAVRDEIHAEVCAQAWSDEKQAFAQAYGSDKLDAAVLMMPLVGFLPASDPRVQGTVAAIQRELTTDGFVARYTTEAGGDGLPPGEGAFLPCSFWLADNLALMGRVDEARALFERLIGLANDVGLLAEEYDPVARRQLGNFPQAFTHLALVTTAGNLSRAANDSLPARHPNSQPT
jgi:GH15 family glucan-1,4-alpha-glucosidase